ncbi:hypothetical protein SM0020_10425 [Sinorhizobium meliloti CCNWSX0020]|uniref:Uncharacterized protein n=1 Tax=Sinorhizobium meliloti CCNWSX0020 TaxID=1107881 RepID=H0FY15_RHIML|nr:hypothetical protein SM0020_10425 [Sinorhizobium meliloti CCNWSX0020]
MFQGGNAKGDSWRCRLNAHGAENRGATESSVPRATESRFGGDGAN